MFSAIDRYGLRASSWWMITIPARSESRMPREGDRRALVDDLALVGAVGVDPGQHLHQGRLPGAVLAADGVHLAALDGQVDVLQCLDPGKVLVMSPSPGCGRSAGSSSCAPSALEVIRAAAGAAAAARERSRGLFALLDLLLGVVAGVDDLLDQVVLGDDHRLVQEGRHDLDLVVVGLGVVDLRLLCRSAPRPPSPPPCCRACGCP